MNIYVGQLLAGRNGAFVSFPGMNSFRGCNNVVMVGESWRLGNGWSAAYRLVIEGVNVMAHEV